MNDLRIAREISRIAREMLSIDFSTKNEYDQYLKDHPAADRKNHRVVENKKQPVKTEKKDVETPAKAPAKTKHDFSREAILKDKPKFEKALKFFGESIQKLEGIIELADKTHDDYEKAWDEERELFGEYSRHGKEWSKDELKEYEDAKAENQKKQRSQEETLKDLNAKSGEISKQMVMSAESSEVPVYGMKKKIDIGINQANIKGQLDEMRESHRMADLFVVGQQIRARLEKGKIIHKDHVKAGDYVFGVDSKYGSHKSVFKVDKVTPSGHVKVTNIGALSSQNSSFPQNAILVEEDVKDEMLAYIEEGKKRQKKETTNE